jgi:hypothetical protein
MAVGAALAVAPMAVLPSTPAHADRCIEQIAELGYTGTHVFGEKYRVCEGGGTIAQPVVIQQKNPNTGAWVTVAQGAGSAAYACQGHSPSKRYRMDTTSQGVLFPCA